MKANLIYTIIVILTLCLFVNCNSTKFTKRYKSIEYKTSNSSKDYVKIEGFSIDINKISSNKTIFDLSDRGQKEIINQTSEKTKSNKELYSQLSKKFVETPKKKNEIINTKFKKRLVISAQNLKNENGADRIESYDVEVTIPKRNRDKLKFAYWDKIVTEYQEIDIGKITYSKTGSFSVSPDITMSGTIKGNIPLNASTSKTIGEEVNLKKKFASISGSISDTSLTVFRNSSPLEDINGNTLVELTLTVENKAEKLYYEFDTLFKKNKPNIKVDEIKVRRVNYQFPNISPKDSEVELTYKFKFREVVKGAKTFTESDDKIRLVSGVNRQKILVQLLDEEDLKKNSWLLKVGKQTLTLKSNSPMPETIRFDSYAKADVFLRWLTITYAVKVGSFQLGLGLTDLQKKDIPKIKIEIE